MIRSRLSKFVLMMIVLMAASQLLLAGRGNINMLPGVLIIYIIASVILNIGKDPIVGVMIAYGMSHFHFATKGGMLGPWLIFATLLLQGWSFLASRYQAKNFSLLVQILFFSGLNLLGLLIKNPNGLFENISNFTSLVGLMVCLLATSNTELKEVDLKFVIQVFGIMVSYTLVSALNNGLGLFSTNSPLVTLNEAYFGSNFAVPMFGRSYSEYFLCMNMLFLNLMVSDTKRIFNLSKQLIVLYYLASFFGCLVGFSKTMTFLLFAGNLIVIARMRYIRNVKSLINVFTGIGLLIALLFFVNQFFSLGYIFERFAAQPEIFQRIYDSPLSAEGTSRSDSFYWGWRRNLDYNWIVGYGWSPSDTNNAAYFHDMNINIRKHDFHSLYLSISPVFGWIGGSIFLLWIISAFVKLSMMGTRGTTHFHKTIGSAFLGLMLVFVLGEYSIPILSEANYFFILIVWLGLINSLYQGHRQAIKSYPI